MPRAKREESKFVPEVEWRNPESLTPYANNAKMHPIEQIDKIAASIAEFGFDQPIVVDARGVIIKGHGRREAALRLGLQRVPIIVRSDLSEAEKKALRIADNKVAESHWLTDILKIELESLSEMDFDLTLTGFDSEELNSLGSFDTELQRSQVFGDLDSEENENEKESSAKEIDPGGFELKCTCPRCGFEFNEK